MGYERPAVEHRMTIDALLVAPVSGGGGDLAQPVWRPTADAARPMPYERPAVESRFDLGADLGRVISGDGGDTQPVWRSEQDEDTDKR